MPDSANAYVAAAAATAGSAVGEGILQVAVRGGLLPPSDEACSLGVNGLIAVLGREPHNYAGTHHSGADWVLVATLGGNATVKAGRQRLRVQAGDVFVMPPGVRFRERSLGPDDWRWICLRLDMADRLAPAAWDAQHPFLLRPGETGIRAMAAVVETLHRRDPGVAYQAVGDVLHLFAVLERVRDPAGRQPIAAFVVRACDVMREYLAEPLTVPDLARRCGMSTSALAHRFKKETGFTPMQWMRQERLRRARELLLAGYSVSETAAATGFADTFHFSRVFRRHEGLPPGRFQRMARATARAAPSPQKP
ncbi:MAG: helix-turn-helix transcriptional regulator [Lentisphaerae bacterium]|nr:helix-turn-helix transcriptional regulator [Lentisphaerota bacterium]